MQNFLNIQYIIKLFHKFRIRYLRLIKPKIVKSAYGIKLSENWADNTFNFYVQGTYGYYFSNYLKSVDFEFVFLDIGANQGLYSILASQNHKCLQVFSFEPIPKTAEKFTRNLQLNNCKNIELISKAISDKVGRIEVKYNLNHTGMASLENHKVIETDHIQTVTIESINHKDLNLILNSLNDNVIVKIDVEGHEITVIKELIQTDFFKNVLAIYYECDENWINPLEMEALLKRNGFNVFNKIGSGAHYDVMALK